jgi:type IV secretory pathway VirB10-like protein
MRRDPRLINIYDRPLHRRPLVARRTSTSFGYGTAILMCVAIVLTTGAFFWLYDAVAHSGTTFAPPTHTAARARIDVMRVPAAAPAPDMNAPEVLHAEADVPPQPAVDVVAHANPDQEPVAAAVRKNKTPRPVKHLPREAREAFAAGTSFYSRPFGGGF